MTSTNNKDNYQFNPYEIFFCGYSGSGKTTLIEKLTAKMSATYRIGYVKHDAHRFCMDQEGKDTARIYSAGASEVFINDSSHSALITRGSTGVIHRRKMLASADFVFVEGYKSDHFPKILLIDEDKLIYQDYLAGKITNVMALVGTTKPHDENSLPYFDRNDMAGIEHFLINYFARQSDKIPLYGLVLAGGKSSRMGTDKAKLVYHNITQAEYCYYLLSQYCEKVFLSARQEQVYYRNFPLIPDSFLDMGPIGGITSAIRAHEAAFLVMACDMPYVTDRTINYLISQRNPFKFATSYINTETKKPEPLCTIYEPKILGLLLDFISFRNYCPAKVLLNSEVKLVKPGNNREMSNINYPEEYQAIKENLKIEI